MEPVRNHRNQAVVNASRLHRSRHRRETGLTLAEGPNLISDAIDAGAQIESIYALADDRLAAELGVRSDCHLIRVDERALQRIAGTETPRGPVAVVRIASRPASDDRDLLVAWGVSDPGNVGTLIRTAAAFDWAFGHHESADPWSPKSIRAGAGGQFQTTVAKVEHQAELADRFVVASVVADGDFAGVAPGERRVALLIGDEAWGLPEQVVAAADARITIATPGMTESLNAAVAAGILVHELSNRSRQDDDQV